MCYLTFLLREKLFPEKNIQISDRLRVDAIIAPRLTIQSKSI